MRKRLIIILLSSFTFLAMADVPLPVTRQPNVPFFMDPYNFKTIELSLFSGDVNGMIINDYGDLMWNPAFLSRVQKRALYLDLNFGYPSTSNQPVLAADYASEYLVSPGWYRQTYIADVQNLPLYNLAFLLPLTKRLTIGLVNRSLFDYGPYRETYYWDYRYLESNSYWDDAMIAGDLAPQRLEVDDNQQYHFGVQTDLMAAYHLNKRFDLGLKIGNYTYRRDGDLYDSKWGTYPHSGFADLNDEELDINGNQYTLGAGLLVHPNENTTWGVYGEFMLGHSDEVSSSVDTSYSWSERDTDPDYYSLNDYDLASNQEFKSEATRPTWTFTYEKEISDKLIFRSFLRHSSSDTDIDFTTNSADTTFSDRTYDTYHNGNYYFQQLTSTNADRQHYNGEGNNKLSHWQWFASYIYSNENDWSLFGGILVNKYHRKNKYFEESDYYSHSDYDYQRYDPHTYQYLNTHEKLYEYKSTSDQYTISFPIGIKVKVIKDFHLILGGEIHYYFTDSSEKGRLLYPEVITKKWENGALSVNDLEEDRYEEYSSNPAADLSRSTNVNLGFVYKHTSGISLYVRSDGNILETYGWNIGLDYRF